PQRFLAGPTPLLHVPMPHATIAITEKPSAAAWLQHGHGPAARGLRRIKKTGGNAGAHPGLAARTKTPGAFLNDASVGPEGVSPMDGTNKTVREAGRDRDV
ncbi:hypothetical protein B5P41_32840, partial [Bacillus sp. SRB_28]